MTLNTNDFIEQITVTSNENKGYGTLLTGIKVKASDGKVIQVGNMEHENSNTMTIHNFNFTE